MKKIKKNEKKIRKHKRSLQKPYSCIRLGLLFIFFLFFFFWDLHVRISYYRRIKR